VEPLEPSAELVAVEVVEEPPVPPARPLAVWPVFAWYVGGILASQLATIPVAFAFALFKVAGGAKPIEISDEIMAFMGTPLGFIVLATPSQLALLGVWWWRGSLHQQGRFAP
jgi:hypothetical protein